MRQIAIGTPLSPSAIKAMLLGSGEVGKKVIIAESFKKRRMGVVLANAKDTGEARARAKLAASKVVRVKA